MSARRVRNPFPRMLRQSVYRYGKRIIDVGAACIALLALSPLFLLLSALIGITMGRPVFFTQYRPGWHARPFRLLKFRTMTNERNNDGALAPDAQRLTALGRFLRATSLDELPELINVVRGEMSLVGPRPLLMQYLERYSDEQRRRHEIRPGITGWAQVNGRNALTWEQKFAHDLYYVDHVSPWFDLKIVGTTIWHVITKKGISAAGYATMPEFMGSDEEEKGTTL